MKVLSLKLEGLMGLRDGYRVALGLELSLHGSQGLGIAMHQEGPGARSAAAVPPKQALLVPVA